MRRICLLQLAHLGSQRVEKKLLQKIGDRTLLDIGIDKMLKIDQISGCPAVLAVGHQDKELLDLAKEKEVEVFLRDDLSTTSELYDENFRGWSEHLRDRFDWVVLTNILCRPFLKTTSILTMIRAAQTFDDTFVTVVKQRGIVWNSQQRCVIGKNYTANTKTNPVYYVLAHLGYGIPVEKMSKEKDVLANQTILEVELEEQEKIDIDTPKQLEFARRVASVYNVDC